MIASIVFSRGSTRFIHHRSQASSPLQRRGLGYGAVTVLALAPIALLVLVTLMYA